MHILIHVPFVTILLLILVNSETSTTEHNEMEILLRLKRDWDYPSALDSWNSTSGIQYCDWSSVSCTKGYVSQLTLSNLNFFKPVPPVICMLKHLSYLDLSNNYLAGVFPLFLYNCSSLQYLDLSQNLFVGKLPVGINNLSPNLSYLNLNGNNFTGDVPKSIGMFSRMRHLFLHNNLFDGSYPAEIGNLSTLEYLSLAWNPFFLPTRIPLQFGNLKNLKFLWMTKSNTIGEIPNTFSNLTELQELDLSLNNISGTIPNWFWSLENLNGVYLFNNKLSGEITGPIEAIDLSKIVLSSNQLTGSIPESFGHLKNLSVLSLSRNSFSGSIPASIGFLPMLKDLWLDSNNLTGLLPPELGKHSNLLNVWVNDNHLSGNLPEYICIRNTLTLLSVSNNNLTGELPASLGNCSTLESIYLHKNDFTGEFPFVIWSAVALNDLIIHDNEFTGIIPDDLPINLTRLDISNNRFAGKIPSSAHALQVLLAANNSFSEIPLHFTKFPQLLTLNLEGNQISGSMPSNFSILLTSLSLRRNQLTGSIPEKLGSLSLLTTLDLSENHLSGVIPPDMNELNLNFLNLSENQLSGMVPSSFQTKACSRSFLSNLNLCTASNSILNLPICQNQTEDSKNSKRFSKRLVIALGLTILGVIGVIVVIGFLKLRKYKRREEYNNNWKVISFCALNFTASDVINGLLEENVIGRGGSGMVYKVCLNNNDEEQVLAVKKIRNIDENMEKQFQAEVEILGSIRHANIVKLLSYISSPDTKLLVYEYVEYNSLDRWIHGREMTGQYEPLNWQMRLQIAIGAAKGLFYMHYHCFPPIIHRDIKSSNILLDRELKAKVADFGLARFLIKASELETLSGVVGTFGYIAPEYGYYRRQVDKRKLDVYSFGVVLLELTTGRRAKDGDEDEDHPFLADWAWRHYEEEGHFNKNAIDESIRGSPSIDEIILVFRLGLICTSKIPLSRPTMKYVLEHLEQYENKPTPNGEQPALHGEVPRLLQGNGSRSFSDIIEEENDATCLFPGNGNRTHFSATTFEIEDDSYYSTTQM